jgi:uncharacterized membrane protein
LNGEFVSKDSGIFSNRASYGLLGLLVVYAVLRSVFAAAAKPLWFDEILTYTVASQPGWHGIVSALRAPLDGNPPLFYVIEQLALRFSQNLEIALRLPSILAFPFTLICVFSYCRRLTGKIIGLLCATLLLTTILFQYYAVEARPYSMVVACFAFAMVCYQRIPSKPWTLLFALVLALAQALHYYAFITMVPFGLAELVYSIRAKALRWKVWAALAFGCLPLMLCWPLLSIFKSFYGPHNWTRVYFTRIVSAYRELTQLGWWRAGEGVVAVLLVVLFAEFMWSTDREQREGEEKAQDSAQICLLAGFLVLPVVGSVVTRAVHSGLLTRYVLCALLGIAGALAFAIQRTSPKLRWVIALLVLCVVTAGEVRFWRHLSPRMAEVKSYAVTREQFIRHKGYADLPVAVPDALAVLALNHYAVASFTDRLVYLKQDPEPNNPRFTDTVDLELELYQKYMPLKVATFDEFTSARSSFLMYVEHDYSRDLWLKRLSRAGWVTQSLASDGYNFLYLVSRNDRSLR